MSKYGHTLEDKSFKSPAACDLCGDKIWGFGKNKRCKSECRRAAACVARARARAPRQRRDKKSRAKFCSRRHCAARAACSSLSLTAVSACTSSCAQSTWSRALAACKMNFHKKCAAMVLPKCAGKAVHGDDPAAPSPRVSRARSRARTPAVVFFLLCVLMLLLYFACRCCLLCRNRAASPIVLLLWCVRLLNSIFCLSLRWLAPAAKCSQWPMTRCTKKCKQLSRRTNMSHSKSFW